MEALGKAVCHTWLGMRYLTPLSINLGTPRDRLRLMVEATHFGPHIKSNFLMARAFKNLVMSTSDHGRGRGVGWGGCQGAGSGLFFRFLQTPRSYDWHP